LADAEGTACALDVRCLSPPESPSVFGCGNRGDIRRFQQPVRPVAELAENALSQQILDLLLCGVEPPGRFLERAES
jgi:hypothetical protein